MRSGSWRRRALPASPVAKARRPRHVTSWGILEAHPRPFRRAVRGRDRTVAAEGPPDVPRRRSGEQAPRRRIRGGGYRGPHFDLRVQGNGRPRPLRRAHRAVRAARKEDPEGQGREEEVKTSRSPWKREREPERERRFPKPSTFTFTCGFTSS